MMVNLIADVLAGFERDALGEAVATIGIVAVIKHTIASPTSFFGSERDRFRWPATNVNILGTSHIPNRQCRSQIPRHKEETHIPCCHNGRYCLSPFELWSMERL